MFEKLPKFMSFISRLGGFFRFDGYKVPVFEGKRRLVTCLSVLDDWRVMCEGGLARRNAVEIRIVFQQLSFFEAYQ